MTLDLVADWRFDHDSVIGQFYVRLTGLRTEIARRASVNGLGGKGKEVRMRTRVRPSAIAVGAVFVLLVALVAPAGAAPPNNPFVGSWESDDGIPASMQFGGDGHFHLRAAPTSVCGEAVPATLLGTFEPYDPGNGTPTVEVTADVYCHYGSAGGRQWFSQVVYFIRYLEDTDTLMSTVCWFRPGSDPSACDSG